MRATMVTETLAALLTRELRCIQRELENLGSSLGMFSRKIDADLRSFKNFIQRRITETISSRGATRDAAESHVSDGNEHVVVAIADDRVVEV